jgi:hypothetical protein
VASASARNTRSKSRVVCIDTTIRLYVDPLSSGAQWPCVRSQVPATSWDRELPHAIATTVVRTVWVGGWPD